MSRVRPSLGVTDADYEDLLTASGSRCWICRNEESVEGRRLAVDHDHRTGAVRGLLCSSCNRRLGGTVDPEWLRRAADYLEAAARAFGDTCDQCGEVAASVLIAADQQGADFAHVCCGVRWTVGYMTRGIPFAWRQWGAPVPTHDAIPPTRSRFIGHPGPTAQASDAAPGERAGVSSRTGRGV